METEKQMVHVLTKGLKAEFDAIAFYLDNLERLDYAKNKRTVDALTLESVEHLRWLTECILALRAGRSGKLQQTAVRRALLEEESMRGIYEYELGRTSAQAMRKLMAKLIAEEKKHEQLVRRLR